MHDLDSHDLTLAKDGIDVEPLRATHYGSEPIKKGANEISIRWFATLTGSAANGKMPTWTG
jgi:hypothetical protein